ncbi:DJ-1/PfpI family protein [Amycolatopsis albispora]|uniref:Thiamine biosynthesis protein ThiJ n=1 Tax=Amycolatopsis albispora TaxID=1804986 RepID=A0A344KZM9_9PSEU|nr:DJ-1/PfpI family protein [Amycolatopsis albispora]AXB41253.1 thiamine biosynthesis protein ThiJ [Amycolatopsis albispora]
MTTSQTTRRTVLAAGAGAGLALGLATPASATPASAAPATAALSTAVPDQRGDGPRIGIALYDGFSLLDPTGPAELLSRVPGATVTMIAERRGPVRTDTQQAAVVADRSFAEVHRLDVLLVPGAGNRGTIAAMRNPVLLDWIRRIDRTTTWTTAVCTGTLVLGAAGLLREKATTYWASADYLEQTFGVRYEAERYVQVGKVITAAGVSAGIDMALYLASLLTDERTARGIQLAVEYAPEPPYDSGDAATASPELKQLALDLLARSQR